MYNSRYYVGLIDQLKKRYYFFQNSIFLWIFYRSNKV